MASEELIYSLLNKIKHASIQGIPVDEEVSEVEEVIRTVLARKDNVIISLQNENAKLKSILNNNSNNCGATTAVDRSSCTTKRKDADEDPENQEPDTKNEKAANEYNGRADKEKRDAEAGIPRKHPGGQVGHKGLTLSEEKALELVALLREKGIEPEYIYSGNNTNDNYKDRYVIGVKLVPHIKIIRCYQNPDGSYAIPEGTCHDSVVSYDTDMHTLINYLRIVCNMPCEKIASLISDGTEGLVNPSTGTVVNSVKYFSESCTKSIEDIVSSITESDVAYTDATYVFRKGENAYIRNMSTGKRVYYAPMNSKSREALEQIAVLPEYNGILIHDHEVVIYHFGTEHGECIIHIMRYCRKDIEDTGNQFANELVELFEDINRQKKARIESGVFSFTKEELDAFSRRYDDIVARGWKENKSTKHEFAKKREATFLNRLEKYKKNHLLFAYNFSVDWSNNLSERDLRKAKRYTAVTGGFRTDSGMDRYCRCLSVIESMKKEKIDLWEGIEWILINKGNIFSAKDHTLSADHLDAAA